MKNNHSHKAMFIGLLALFLLSSAQPASADWWHWGKGKRVKGSGKLATEIRDLEDFNSIQIKGSSDLDITIGESFSVTVETDDNLLELLETEVRHGTLYVDFADGYSVNTRIGSRLEITMPDLEELNLKGASDIRASGLNGKELSISIFGSGDVTLSGEVEDLEVDIRGSGDIDAKKLVAREAYISIKGSGDVGVAVDDFLDADIKGSGDITYYGDPKVKKRVWGSGDITHRHRPHQR